MWRRVWRSGTTDENGSVAGKRKKEGITQDKKTREVETSTAKKNTVKSQEQKGIS